jgi:alkylhydroperoxidase family enzyme
MARIPYPDLSAAPEDVRALAANFPPLNIFRMLPHMPTFLRGFGQLGTAISVAAELDARLRELIILRVGKTLSRSLRVAAARADRAQLRSHRRRDRGAGAWRRDAACFDDGIVACCT